MELKLIEIKRGNFIYKYSQLEDLTDVEVDNALSRGFLGYTLSGVKTKNDDCRYHLNINKETNELILCDSANCAIILRGVNNIRDFMIKNDLGVIESIIELEH